MQGISIREKIFSRLIKKKDAGVTKNGSQNGSLAIAGLLAVAAFQGFERLESLHWTRNNWKPNSAKTRSARTEWGPGHGRRVALMVFASLGYCVQAMGFAKTLTF